MTERNPHWTVSRVVWLWAVAAAVLGVAVLATSDSTSQPGHPRDAGPTALLPLDLTGNLAPKSLTAGATVTAGPLAVSTSASLGLPVALDGNPLCTISGLCIRLVTHYTPTNGPEVVREHEIVPGIGDVAVLVGSPIDATGDGISDLAVAVGAPFSVLPPGVDRERPGVKIERFASAPATFPVKVEAVIDVVDEDPPPGRKLSLGYDARGSTAPTRFIAKTDLRDRDGLEETDQKKADLTIARGPSDNVALVTETFTAAAGLGERQRTERDITRLTYRGDAGGAHVPPTAGVDVTKTQDGNQRFVLTRAEDQPTIVDFLTDDGALEPTVTTGTIDRLPSSVDLTIVNKDVNGDGEKDKEIDYWASDEVDVATVNLSQPLTDEGDPAVDGDEVVHRRDVGIEAHQLPTNVKAHFAAPTPDQDPPNPKAERGTVSLEASGRTVSVVVSAQDELPIFERARAFRLELLDVPRVVDAVFGGGKVAMGAFAAPDRRDSDAVGMLQFTGQDTPGEAIVVPACETSDCNDGFDVVRDPQRSGAIRDGTPDNYALFARIHNLKSASIVTDPDPGPDADPHPTTDTTDVFVDTAPDFGPPGSGCGEFPPPGCDARTKSFRPFEALVKSERDDDDPSTPAATTLRAELTALLPGTRFAQTKVGADTDADPSDDLTTITYDRHPSEGSPDLVVEADNLDGPDNKYGQEANNLRVVLERVPTTLFFSTGPGGMEDLAARASRSGGFPLKLCTSSHVETKGPAASCDRRGEGPALNRVDVLLSSDAATEADLLPLDERIDNHTIRDPSDDYFRNLAGVRLRDYPDRYAIHARMPGVRSATIDKKRPQVESHPCQAADDLVVELDRSELGNSPRLRFDSQKKFLEDPCAPLDLPGMESQFLTLDRIPNSLSIHKFTGESGETRLFYSASETIGTPEEFGHCAASNADYRVQPDCGGFQVTQTTNYENPAPDPVLHNKFNSVSVVPMPRTLTLCRSDDTDVCSEGVFDTRVPPGETVGATAGADAGSLRITALPRARFNYFDRPNSMLGAYTLVDLTVGEFTFQGDSKDFGYLAFDTGWRPTSFHQPAPAAEETTRGILKSVGGLPQAGEPEVTEFRFGEGFAADRRIIGWPNAEALFVANEADISELFTMDVGQVLCPHDTGVLLVRQNRYIPEAGPTLDLDLTDELCHDGS